MPNLRSGRSYQTICEIGKKAFVFPVLQLEKMLGLLPGTWTQILCA